MWTLPGSVGGHRDEEVLCIHDGILFSLKQDKAGTRGYLNLGGTPGKVKKGHSELLRLDCPDILLIFPREDK